MLNDGSHRNIRTPPDPHSMRINTQHIINTRSITEQTPSPRLNEMLMIYCLVKLCCVYLLVMLPLT